jgi:uncharacterized protein DUF4407/CHAT domain-containing protein
MEGRLALVILLASGITATCMWFALTSFFGINPFASVALAVLCGLITAAIDWWLVDSAPSGGRRRFVLAAIPRVLLALVLGAIIAVPVALRIFQPAVSRQVTVTQRQHVNALRAQRSAASQQAAYWRDQVAGVDRAISLADRRPSSYRNNRKLARLAARQRAALEHLRRSYREDLCHIGGGLSCQSAGTSSSGSADAQLSFQAAAYELGAISDQIQSSAVQLSADQSAYQRAVSSLPRAQLRAATALARQKVIQRRLDALNAASNDPFTRAQALGQVANQDATIGMVCLLLLLLLLSVGSMPVSVRALQLAGKYGAAPRPAGRVTLATTVPAWSTTRTSHSAAAPAGEPAGARAEGTGSSRAGERYLKGQCPDTVPVGKPFSLLASIVLAASGNAGLEHFDVPSEGRDVLLVLHAPGVRMLGDQRMTVHVPAEGDSRPVMFELQADVPGRRSISITAWLAGTYLGELVMEVAAERGNPTTPHRDVLAGITTESTQGAVSLVVRYDPVQNAYRFEFRDEDNPSEVKSELAFEPRPRIEQLVAGLDELAKGRSGYSADQTRDYLVNSGAALWRELVPRDLREQFWDRQKRIRQLTILADKDAVPWELLYPKDPGHDAGFLVEQFPVTRGIFGRRPASTLGLRPARFVLPEGSLPEARAEVEAMQRLLAPGQSADAVISALTPLTNLIKSGDFGLLHFACHNRFDPADGSSIKMGSVQFTPTLMTTVTIDKPLEPAAPTVFMNACRSAGLHATYNQLDGWASRFLEAGAAAFVGSLWSVTDGTARDFAAEFYRQLQAGASLGEAMTHARHVAASQLDDPTWLAYTVYGDPRAKVGP